MEACHRLGAVMVAVTGAYVKLVGGSGGCMDQWH